MANIYKRFKRKKRTSDSDLETISPEEEEKSLWDEASHVDDAITDSPGDEDKIIEALDMTQSGRKTSILQLARTGQTLHQWNSGARIKSCNNGPN